MAEYIEREALFRSIADDVAPFNVAMVFRHIHNAPAADVAKVRHGQWEVSTDEWFGTDVYTCSKCRESYVLVEGTPKENLWHYCPNCGANMAGE